ncbi:MAG: HAD family hydrolase [Fretibacterium sp.]|nr:HAD family hydrolase [Fretibacterium sp.]
MKKKHLFFDIDGTLVSHVGASHVPAETRAALEGLRAKGHTLAIATARSFFLTRPVAKELEFDLLVCSSGAHVLQGDRTLRAIWLPDSAFEPFRDAASAFPEEAAALDDRWTYSDGVSDELRAYLNDQAGYDCIRPISDLRQAFSFYFFAPSTPPDCRLFHFPPPDVTFHRTSHYAELRAAGTTKWSGILELTRHLGFPQEDIITFGDGSNDMEMLREAGLGVAVGAAHESAKAVADLVTDDIDSGGILNACRTLGLL